MNGTPWGFQEFQMQEAVLRRQKEQELAQALQSQQLQSVQNPLQGLALVLRGFFDKHQNAKKDAALSEQLQGFFQADEQRRQQELAALEAQRQKERQEGLEDYGKKQRIKSELNPQGGAGPKVLGPGAQLVTMGPDGKAQVLHSNAFKPSNLGFQEIQLPDGRTVQAQVDPLSGAIFGLDGRQLGPAVRAGIPQTGVSSDAVIAEMNRRVQAGESPEAVEAWGQSQLAGLGMGQSPAEQTKATEDAKRESERQANLPKMINTAEQTLAVLDQAIAHPGRETATGVSGKLDPRNYLVGTEATDFGVMLDQLKGKAFLQAFESLKGGGQITQIEGTKAQEAMARLNTAQSDTEFLKALQEMRGIVSTALQRAKGGEVSEGPKRLRFNPETGELE